MDGSGTTLGWQTGPWAGEDPGIVTRTERRWLSPRRAVWWQLVNDARAASPAGGVGNACRDERLRRLEVILLLAREPLSSRKLSQYANLADATEARTLIRRLNELYDQSGRAFRVEDLAQGYQLLTRPSFAIWLRRLQGVPGELRLSAPALETLAVVAYRQPIGRAGIEAIRGVSCGEILRQLLDRDLLRTQGRSEELGRPYLYGTTKRFLQLFGLKNLDDLPRAAVLRDAAAGKSAQVKTTDSVLQQGATAGPDREKEEESDVTATIFCELSPEESLQHRLGESLVSAPRSSDEDEDLEELDDEDDDEDDDLDEEFEDDEEFDEELDEDEDDFDDDEWEEVDDEDDDWDDEDDDDLDWDDDDEDDDEDEKEDEPVGDE